MQDLLSHVKQSVWRVVCTTTAQLYAIFKGDSLIVIGKSSPWRSAFKPSSWEAGAGGVL